MRTVKAAPRASLLIESMRDIGYSLETALADVIDNCITAGAGTIEIFADTGESDPSIAVVDDGIGMTEDELFSAMQLGCRNPLDDRNATDLGRFGLGLKTASFSQCRRLTVVSRRDGRTSTACWDLDLVAEKDEWIVQVPDDLGLIRWSERLGETGTLILWEELDRAAGRDLVRRVDEAARHVELVFH